MNKFAVVDQIANKIVARATHYQLAASQENDLSAQWLKNFVGPQQSCVVLPYTVCRIDALSRRHPSVAV